MKAIAVIPRINGHAVKVIENFNPTYAKNTGANNPNVTEDTALRTRLN